MNKKLLLLLLLVVVLCLSLTVVGCKSADTPQEQTPQDGGSWGEETSKEEVLFPYQEGCAVRVSIGAHNIPYFSIMTKRIGYSETAPTFGVGENIPAFMVDSVSQLHSTLRVQSSGQSGDDASSALYVYENMPDFGEDFFDEHSLILCTFLCPGGGYEYGVESVRYDEDTLRVNVRSLRMGGGAAVSSQCVILVVVKKADVKDCAHMEACGVSTTDPDVIPNELYVARAYKANGLDIHDKHLVRIRNKNELVAYAEQNGLPFFDPYSSGYDTELSRKMREYDDSFFRRHVLVVGYAPSVGNVEYDVLRWMGEDVDVVIKKVAGDDTTDLFLVIEADWCFAASQFSLDWAD